MISGSDKPQVGERERILVIRFSSLGDILLTAPAIRALRTRFADAEICLLVAHEYENAAALIPGLDRVLTFDRSTGVSGLWKLRGALSRRFGMIVDLQNSARSAFLRVATFPLVWVKAKRYRLQRWLLVRFKWNLYPGVVPVPVRYLQAIEVLGAQDDAGGLSLQVAQTARDSVAPLLHGLPSRSRIALCPGARHFTKRWPADRWRELGRILSSEGHALVLMGSENERDLVDGIASVLPGSLTVVGRAIPEVAAIMEQCSAVDSNDSALMHLAGGIGTPVIAIFGPTVEEFGFFPFRARARVVQQDLKCRPCSAMGSEICAERHFRCMMDTTPRSVASAIHTLLADDPRHS